MIDTYFESTGKPVTVIISCEFCGKKHEELMIDCHISKPHLCNECWKKSFEELRRRGYRP